MLILKLLSYSLIQILLLIVLISPVHAAVLAEQTQEYSASLNVWQTIQELGSGLEGPLKSFTFRIHTTYPKNQQFDYTAQNTQIYDKTTNTVVAKGCVPDGAPATDKLRGLIFNTEGVPEGFEDVTIDFSCRNFSFTKGYQYLILITNANHPHISVVPGRILFASSIYQNTANDYFTGGGLRYAFDNVSCKPLNYIWNSQIAKAGCNIFTSPGDDLYFILSDTIPEPSPTPTPSPTPSPKTPVIFIPGIGGSQLKANQDIFWADQDDGHGGRFSHAYSKDEKIWVNQVEAAKLGDDDYFDVLRFKDDGITSEADLALTGDLTSFGYGDIDSFFQGLGYEKGKNFFIFAYDWRKDIRSTKDDLDVLIETAKTASGQTKVNIVAHSMGGLVARYYIADTEKAGKVDKLIGLGVPHLGAVKALKTIMYGSWLGYDFKVITLGIPPSETKDVFKNLPSASQLLPSKDLYKFYDNSNSDLLYPFRDDRDIDNDKTTGVLNFSQIKTLLTNLTYNMTVFAFGEQFHDDLSQKLNQNNGVDLYHIVGSNQPTLGQIHETWWITWPVNFLPKTDEIFINGDGTVPLYSASLKRDSLDLSGGAIIYFVDQRHGDLVSSDGTAMQTVKSILAEDSLPVEVKTQKIDLEGQQVSIDDGKLDLSDDTGNHTGLNSNGELETNIPGVFYSTNGKSIHAFIKKSAGPVSMQVTSTEGTVTTDIKIRQYQADQIVKTAFYNDVLVTPSSKAEFTLSQGSIASQTIQPAAEIQGAAALDQTPPATKIDKSGTNPVTITLTGTDLDSGILKIEYSLDNGQTIQTYAGPFAISNPGKTTLQVKSIDKLGNEEIPQEIILEIAPQPSSSDSSDSSDSNSSTSTSSQSNSSTSEEPVPVTSEVLQEDTSQEKTFFETKPTSEILQNDSPEVNLTGEVLGIAKEEEQKPKNNMPLQHAAVLVLLLPTVLPAVSAALSSLSSFTSFRPFGK